MSEEAITLLRSIDASLKILASAVKSRQAAAPKPVASDSDLDGNYGDPVLKFKPRDWAGPSYKDSKFSQCPADLLDMVADSLDYFAKVADEKDERTSKGKPVADFKRADAARARGWAKRIREGTHKQEPVTVPTGDGWDSAAAEGWD